MHPGIFFGLALFLGLFWFAGNVANMFMLNVIGLTGMGVFTVLTGFTITKVSEWINKSFETKKNYPTFILKAIVLLVGFGLLIGSINHWKDLPLYQNQKYSVVHGKPTSVDEYISKGTVTGLYVEIKGQIFDLDADLPNFPEFKEPEELLEKHFTIYYLPNSNWILDYKVE